MFSVSMAGLVSAFVFGSWFVEVVDVLLLERMVGSTSIVLRRTTLSAESRLG